MPLAVESEESNGGEFENRVKPEESNGRPENVVEPEENNGGPENVVEPDESNGGLERNASKPAIFDQATFNESTWE